MATGKALDGKPYAGNPHVRFDEGEVAPAATPRRGSLLYKKSILLVSAAVSLAMGARGETSSVSVEGYPWTTEVHPDWATELSGKTKFTIPANTAWIVDGETDMTTLNNWISALATKWGNIKFGNANSALILDNTTTWFSNGAVFNGAKGSLVKRGASTLANTGADLDYLKGNWYVEEGTLKEANHYFNNTSGGYKVIVKSGATFWKAFNCPNGNTEIVLEGTGVGGNGALIVDKCKDNGMLPRVTLAGDALVALNVNGTFFDHYIPEASPGHYTVAVNPAELKLNGHTLTIGGTAATIGFRSVNVTSEGSPGSIVLSPLANAGVRTLDLLSGANLSADVSITTMGDAKVLFDGAVDAQNAAIAAAGNLTFEASSSQGASDAVWAGSVQIAAGKSVAVNPGDSGRTVTISGVISGEGGLQIGASGAAASGNVRILSENVYEGATLVNTSGNVFLGSIASIPDLDTMTLTAGTLYAAPRYGAGGELTFDADGVLALQARMLGATTVRIDTSELTNAADLTITPDDVVRHFPGFGLTWSGYGTGAGYTLEGPYADAANPLALNVGSGTVRVTGEGTINLGTSDSAVAGIVSGSSASSYGTVVFDGAKDVVYGDQKFVVGNPTTSSIRTMPRVVVTNSTIRSTCTGFGSDIFKGAFFVGHKSAGILEVEDGAVVSNKLVVGGGDSSNSGYGCGAVYQRGGLVTPTTHLPADNSVYNSSLGGAGLGYYALEGGTFRPTAMFPISIYAYGTFLQTGGLAWLTGTEISSWTGDGVYTVLGGTTVVTNSQFMCVKASTGSSVVTVQGEGSVFDSSRALYNRTYCFQTAGGSPRAYFNFNDGGTYRLSGLLALSDHTAQAYPLVLNFNGGRLHFTGVHETPLFWDSDDAKSKTPAEVAVYEKGAVFSVDAGKSVTTEPSAISAHKTGGIKALRIPEGGFENCPAAPLVKITSSTGHGASAIALVDTRTCTVTNILMTSSGWGYEAGSTTVTLYLAKYAASLYTLPAANIEVGDNDIGGLTMEGPGTLTLGAAGSQWEKWTKVTGGTLKAGVAGAIPSGTVLTLSNGGTLDLNNTAGATFAGLAGSGGTVANGPAVMEEGMTVSAKKLIDRETTAVSGTLDLSGVTTLTLTDTDVLDESAKQMPGVMLFTATNLVLPPGGVTVAGVPDGFRATWRPNGLRLAPDRGFAIIFR